MSLSEEYHKETGLNSCYYGNVGSQKKYKKGLVYTRKYVWFLECKVKELRKQLEEKENIIETYTKEGKTKRQTPTG